MTTINFNVGATRELRARHYRDNGESYAQIARRLGMREVGVQRMFKRIRLTGS